MSYISIRPFVLFCLEWIFCLTWRLTIWFLFHTRLFSSRTLSLICLFVFLSSQLLSLSFCFFCLSLFSPSCSLVSCDSILLLHLLFIYPHSFSVCLPPTHTLCSPIHSLIMCFNVDSCSCREQLSHCCVQMKLFRSALAGTNGAEHKLLHLFYIIFLLYFCKLAQVYQGNYVSFLLQEKWHQWGEKFKF